MAAKTLRSIGHRALIHVLVKLRKDAQLTQRELAERLDKPRSYVSKIETGERLIDPVECVGWARACGREPIELFVLFLRDYC